MNRFVRFLLIPALAVGSCLIPASAAPAPIERPKPDNGALRYWQAFALMPQSKEQESYIDSWETVPIDNTVAELVKSADYALKCMHGGVETARCDWGLDYEEGPALAMPHLVRARQLGRLALLRARYRFQNGDARGGVEDATAVLKLGRDVGDPILINLLVQYAIQNAAVDALARYLPQLDAATLKDLAARLDRLPADDRMKQVWGTETKYFVDWFATQVSTVQAKDDDEWRQKVLALPIFTPEDVQRLKGTDMPSRQQLPQVLEHIRAYYRELEKLTDLPADEQDAAFQNLKGQYGQENALFKFLSPDVSKVFQRRRQWQARRAMLKAAVAVQQSGLDALKQKDLADPFGQGPFEYRKTEGGFELRSKLTADGKPVVLTVGAEPKKG